MSLLCRWRPSAIAPSCGRLFRPLRFLSTSASSPALPPISVLRLDHLRLPIRSQLLIEEALLRSKDPRVTGRSFFLLNQPPTWERTIVMGLSNRTELLVHMDAVQRDGIGLLRRFSGGGTVYVDQHCWMATMLVHKHPSAGEPQPAHSNSATLPVDPLPALPHNRVHPASLPPYPNTLMGWTRDFYSPVFGSAGSGEVASSAVDAASHSSSVSVSADGTPTSLLSTAALSPPPFSLTGHDYCFASRKFGGNAQTITRDRWLHHTSFLWGLEGLGCIEQYLQVPAKQPEYRAGRSHTEFLTSLREVWQQVEAHRREQHSRGSTTLDAVDREPTAEELALFERENAPSKSPLFDTFANESNSSAAAAAAARPHAGGASSPSSSPPSDVSIPSSLSARVLWRLSHFYTLEYPALDDIADIVQRYAQEATSSVKVLHYEEERERAKREAREKEEKEEKARAAAGQAIASAAS